MSAPGELIQRLLHAFRAMTRPGPRFFSPIPVQCSRENRYIPIRLRSRALIELMTWARLSARDGRWNGHRQDDCFRTRTKRRQGLHRGKEGSTTEGGAQRLRRLSRIFMTCIL